MGGYVAVRTALRPGVDVTHLVLAATSGGLDMPPFDAIDWRPGSRAAHPTAPAWAFEPTADLTHEIAGLAMPVLLVWANRDEISPIGAGLHLLDLVPDVRLIVFDNDDHWVARIHADEVARQLVTLLGVDQNTD